MVSLSVVVVGASFLVRIMGYRDSLSSLASLFQCGHAQETLLWAAENGALLQVRILSLRD